MKEESSWKMRREEGKDWAVDPFFCSFLGQRPWDPNRLSNLLQHIFQLFLSSLGMCFGGWSIYLWVTTFIFFFFPFKHMLKKEVNGERFYRLHLSLLQRILGWRPCYLLAMAYGPQSKWPREAFGQERRFFGKESSPLEAIRELG